MKRLILSLLLVSGVTHSKVTYPEIQIKKFKSGKIQQKTKYVAVYDIEESEVFYENGKPKLKYLRTVKSNEPFKSDIYQLNEWDDEGRELFKGTCKIPTTENFYGDGPCYKLSGRRSYYDEEGKLTTEQQLTDGQLDGVSTNHLKDKILKETFKMGVRTKREEIDSNSKAVLKTEEYFPDGSKK